MISLILTILLTVVLFICFKEFSQRNINTHQAITFNYLTASLLAFIFYEKSISFIEIINSSWIFPTIALGVFFIIMFNVMAKTTQRLGISIASMASKISLIIPVIGAILLQENNISYTNGLGILIAIIAIYLAFKKKHNSNQSIYIAIILFFGTGILDMCLDYIQHNLLENNNQSSQFIIVVFFIAFIAGLIKIILSKEKIKSRNIIAGIFLGIPNYLSIYYVLISLEKLGGVIVFPILNISVVLLSTILSFFVYKEYLNTLNWTGIVLACISIILILVF
tara:strand:+ start:3305 stop:4144 length:840 start_codon:yes stop_codon:yes gene_type:complete